MDDEAKKSEDHAAEDEPAPADDIDLDAILAGLDGEIEPPKSPSEYRQQLVTLTKDLAASVQTTAEIDQRADKHSQKAHETLDELEALLSRAQQRRRL